MNWVLFWLFFHVAGAIIAFGPTFAFPIIGMMAAKNPRYGHFAAELNHAIESKLVLPVAGSMLVSGIGLIIAGGYNLTKAPWLGAGIILYVTAMGIASGYVVPHTRKLVEATAGGPPEGEPAAGAPAGPPAHVARLIKQIQTGGMIMTAMLIVIIFLMVVKPGG